MNTTVIAIKNTERIVINLSEARTSCFAMSAVSCAGIQLKSILRGAGYVICERQQSESGDEVINTENGEFFANDLSGTRKVRKVKVAEIIATCDLANGPLVKVSIA